MRRTLGSSILLTAASLFASAAASASVWLVDDDGGLGVHFQDIQSAVNAAQDGDLILVKPGTYPASVLIQGKGVQVFGDPAGSVNIRGPAVLVQVTNLTAAQRVVLRGLTMRQTVPSVPVTNPGLVRILDCAGPVFLEDCDVDGNPTTGIVRGLAAVAIRDSASVSLARCELVGSDSRDGPPRNGVEVTGATSKLHVLDSMVRGGSGILDPNCDHCEGLDGGSGLVVWSSTVFLGGSTFVGGDGGDGSDFTWPFILCEDGGDGGDGLRMYLEYGSSIPPLARALGAVFVGGAPGQGGSGSIPCQDGDPGAGTALAAGTLIQYPGVPRTLSASTPVRESQALQLAIGALAGDVVWIAYAPFPMAGVYSPTWNGPFFLGVPFFLVDAGTLPGSLTVPITIPELGAGVEGLSVMLQCFHVDAGGGVFITPPTVAALIDAGS